MKLLTTGLLHLLLSYILLIRNIVHNNTFDCKDTNKRARNIKLA